MNGDFSNFLRNLAHLFETMEVHDDSGNSLSLDDGANAAIELICDTRNRDRKAMVIGNGGSAAIASHTQNDLCKSVGLRSLVFTETPLLTALANDNGYETVYDSLVKLWAEPGDLLIAISSSGRSENILRTVRRARDVGCRVITLSGFTPDNPLRRMGHVNFYVPSGSYGPVEIAHATLCQFLTDASTPK